MARPKTDTKAPQGATATEGEGVKAPVVVPEAGASAGEHGSSAPDPAEIDADPEADDRPKVSGIIVRVVAKQPSRWRIGLHFTAEPSHLQLDNLTEAEVAALRSDPMLDVTAFEDI